MFVMVNDNKQNVSLLAMTAAQFLSLSSVLIQARRSGNPYVRELATGLHLSTRWSLETFSRTVSLQELSWEEVCVLEAFIISWRAAGNEGPDLDKILEALDAAMESVTRVQRDESKGRIRY